MSNPTECFHIKWFWMGNSEQMGDVKHCWTPLVFIVSGMVVSRHDQRLDGMCALGLCQWFCLRVGSDLSRRHLGRTSVFSLIWMISTHRSLFFSRVTLRVSKARASMKFMRGMADMRKIWHDTSYLSAYNSEFMWIWKLNHCCCEFLKCHWKERIASIQQPPLWIASLSSCCPRRVWCAYSMLL